MSWRFCRGKLFPLLTGDDHTPLLVDLSMSLEHLVFLKFPADQRVWVQIPDRGCSEGHCITSEEQKEKQRRTKCCMKLGNSGIFICPAVTLDLCLLGLRKGGEVLGAERIPDLELSLQHHPDFSEIGQVFFVWVYFQPRKHGSPFPAIFFISSHRVSPPRFVQSPL